MNRLRKARLATALAVLALSTDLPAAEMYRWKDNEGRTVYSDKPPTGAKVQTEVVRTNDTGNARVSSGATDWTEKEREFRRRRIEEREARGPEEERKKQACEAARRRSAQLKASEGQLLFRTDKNGERVFIGDDERAALASESERAIAENCGR